jgi:voltage-gated potassium channel
MIGGVALIGVVTASFAAWFIDRVRSDEEDVQAATQRDLETLTARIEELTAEVRSLRAERVSGQR